MAELVVAVLMWEVLPRLPAKSLGRFKCVCKEWLSFLSTNEFVRLHCLHMSTSLEQKILSICSRLCLTDTIGYVFPTYSAPRVVHIPFNARPHHLLFLGSVGGLVCTCLKNTSELVIWNPLTHAYKKLPRSKFNGFYKPNDDGIGFFVDSLNEYKILHIRRRRCGMTVYVYSMRLDSWRKIRFLKTMDYPTNFYSWSLATLCGDCLYFTVGQCFMNGDKTILRFDVNSESFTDLGFPVVAVNERGLGNLVNAQNELKLFVSHGFFTRSIELWRLDCDKWMRELVLPQGMDITLSLHSSITYVKATGNFVVLLHWGDVYEIDLKTNEVISFYPVNYFQGLMGVVFTETLMSPNV